MITGEHEKKANDILEVIMAYARLDFSVKTKVSDQGDVFDAISSGINMLGEELQVSSVSLKEKNQLLREIHHRVKNNMQIISSLLKLQSDSEKNERLVELLEECQNRIKSIALIHEMLYATTNFKYANFKEYVSMLLQSLVYSYSVRNKNIQVNIEIDEAVCMDIDRIIPLGLIINEVVTNSLKHAFTNREAGAITISLLSANHQLTLSIADDGMGINEDLREQKTGGLGMQIIQMLSEQISSSLEICNKGGTTYKMCFPEGV